jgi:thioredoxin-related protein
MKRLVLGLAFLSQASLGFAQERGIKFEGNLNWTQIKAKAKSENKHIFMDVFATWCGPCKEMDHKVYSSDQVGSYMNDKFVSVKVQTDQTKKDSEAIKAWYKDAKDIIKVYKIGVFPSFLYFSPEGKLVYKDGGAKSIEAFISSAGAAIDSSTSFAKMADKFNRRQMDYILLPEFAKKAKSLNQPEYAQEIANEYINAYLLKLKDQDLFTAENLGFIGSFLGDENSKAFKLFIKQTKKIDAALGDYAAENKIIDFIGENYIPKEGSWKDEKPDWDILQKKIVSKFGYLGQEALWGKRMIYHLQMEDNWSEYAKYYVLYFQKAYKHSIWHVNNTSWPVFEHIDNQKVLKFACDTVMKYLIEEKYLEDAAAYDTYANLLYKTDRREEAIKWEERSVKLSNQDKGLLETLEKMKNGIKTWPDTAAKP